MIHLVQEDHTMPKPLSADIRDRFRMLFESGLSGREAARRLLISAATASRLTRRLKRGASLQPEPNPRKSGRGELAPYHDFLVELVTQDPDITLAELRGALEHAHGVRASISGVDQALRRLGYTFKKRASSRMNAAPLA
jgi:transposase